MLLGGNDAAVPPAEATRSRRYDVRLVDRVGEADSFAAGLIHGLLSMGSAEDALEFAVAASALRQTISGDLNLSSALEVKKLAPGSGSDSLSDRVGVLGKRVSYLTAAYYS